MKVCSPGEWVDPSGLFAYAVIARFKAKCSDCLVSMDVVRDWRVDFQTDANTAEGFIARATQEFLLSRERLWRRDLEEGRDKVAGNTCATLPQ